MEGKLKIYFRLHVSKGCMGLRGDQKNRGGVKMAKQENPQLTSFHAHKTATKYRVTTAENDKDYLGRTSTTQDLKKNPH